MTLFVGFPIVCSLIVNFITLLIKKKGSDPVILLEESKLRTKKEYMDFYNNKNKTNLPFIVYMFIISVITGPFLTFIYKYMSTISILGREIPIVWAYFLWVIISNGIISKIFEIVRRKN
jgi:hypothetical protein